MPYLSDNPCLGARDRGDERRDEVPVDVGVADDVQHVAGGSRYRISVNSADGRGTRPVFHVPGTARGFSAARATRSSGSLAPSRKLYDDTAWSSTNGTCGSLRRGRTGPTPGSMPVCPTGTGSGPGRPERMRSSRDHESGAPPLNLIPRTLS